MHKPPQDPGTEMVVREMVPGWIQSLRDLAAKHLGPEVIEDIVVTQIAAARRGDARAIKFVFDYLLGAAALKGATFVQNNYPPGAARPDQPTAAVPGSAEKIRLMQARVAGGLDPCRPDDVPAGREVG